MKAGPRDSLITIERATVELDDRGSEIKKWSPFARAWAQVVYGAGQERREAARLSASAPATFRLEWSPTLNNTTPRDRIYFNEYYWEISSIVPLGNDGIEVSAIALVDARFKRAAGTVLGAGNLTGSLSGVATFSATVQGASALGGTLRGFAQLEALLSGSAAVTGHLTARATLASIIPGAGTLAGTMTARARFSGYISGASTFSGSLSRFAQLHGLLNGATTLTAALRGRARFGGTVTATGTPSGTLTAAVPAPPAGQVMLTDDDGQPLYVGDQYLTEAA